MDKLNFGDRLKIARCKKKLSQKELAQLSKIAQPIISKYEKNRIKPSYENLQRLINVLDTSADYLLNNNVKNEIELLKKSFDRLNRNLKLVIQ